MSRFPIAWLCLWLASQAFAARTESTRVTFAGGFTVPNGATVSGVTIGMVTGLQAALDAKAALASPHLTGVPTAPTATNGTNTTQLATTAFVLANAIAGNIAHTTLALKGDNTGGAVAMVAGVDYIAVTATPAAGKVPVASDATHAAWAFITIWVPPTSCSGLPTGAAYNNGGAFGICP